jgi:hypothetical protein
MKNNNAIAAIKIYLTFFITFSILIAGCGNGDFKEEDTTEFEKLSWMLGIWKGKQGDAELYESWRKVNYRIMEGISYTTQDKTRIYSQTMRLEQSNNKIFLLVTLPNSTEPITLDLEEIAENKAVFVNNEIEYPKRIVYLLEKENAMKVILEGDSRENITEFNYIKTD